MNKEVKQRFLTGTFLLSLLPLMFISKILYVFVFIVFFSLSFIEFSKITKKIFPKSYLKQFFVNLFFAAYIFLILLIFIIGVNDVHFKIILFLILIVCVASDIGGYVSGKFLQGPKLTKISPNKTISGSLGSIFLSIIVSYFIFNNLLNLGFSQNILLGLLISLAVQFGDLFISYLKRKSSLKHTGNILPGHGGILDRIDGILLGLPVGLIFLLIIISKI